MDDVELSHQGDTAFVRLRRPKAGNALRAGTFDAIRKTAIKLADAPPRFVVLTGEGEDFCVGLDSDPSDPLFLMVEPMVRQRDAHRAAEIVGRLRGSLEALFRLPCPILAAIEGRCAGAGFDLAMMADLRVVGDTVKAVPGEAHRGILTGLGSLSRLTVMLGSARAAELLLTRRELDALALHELGLASRVVPAGGALGAAIDLAHELKRQGNTARTQTLLALRQIHQRLEKDLVDQEAQAAARTWIAGEYRETAP